MPAIQYQIVHHRNESRRGRSPGMFGNMGRGQMPGGSTMGGSLGSLIGMLSGGRRFGNSGGLFSRVLRGGF